MKIDAVDDSTALNPGNYQFRNYYYEYHKKYGSDQMDVKPIPVTNVKISADHKKISLMLSVLQPGYVYELKLENIKNQDGMPLTNKLICYTLNNLKK